MTVLESPRTTLPDLEIIKKVFVEKYNKKAKANKARLQQPPRLVKRACPGSAQMGACLIESLRRTVLLSIDAGARLIEGPRAP